MVISKINNNSVIKTFLFAVVLAGLFILLSPHKVDALSGSSFQAGRIIDDSVFFDSSTMSASDIQNFLNAKVPVCDTNGSQPYGGTTRAAYGSSKGYPPPYVCLRNYMQATPNRSPESGLCTGFSGGDKSAAQIIQGVAQSCGINPKVLIVLLQKEQSLVTDEWPWSIQYRSATGYGCPDTAACDSQYYGFFNQVYEAARAYKRYAINAGSYNYRSGRNNSILYHPNGACGSSTVYIENQATANLYIYTPYRPNQAALNNLYGTGDGCSSYGNRNFWRMFNDWFGSTLAARDLVTNEQGIFYVSNGYKYYIPSMAEFYNYGYSDADIGMIPRISNTDLATIPSNPNSRNIPVVIASSEQGIFLVSNGYKYYIPSMALFYEFGFQDSDIIEVSEQSIDRFPRATNNLNTIISDPRGFTFKVEDAKRRGIYQPYVLQRYPEASTGSKLSDATLSRIRPGVPIIDGKFTVISSTGTFFVSDDSWYAVPRAEVAVCNGSTDTVAMNISQGIAATPLTTYQSCFVKYNTGEKYLLDGNKKYIISDNNELNFSAVTSGNSPHITAIQASNSANIFSNSDGIYEVQKGKSRHIMSMSYVRDALGNTAPPVLRTNSVKYLPKGGNLYVNSTLLSSSAGGIRVVLNKKTSYIGSMDQFYAYGFRTGNIVQTSNSDMEQQESGPNLPGPKVKDNTGLYVIAGGRKYKLLDADITPFGGTSAFVEIDATFLATLPSSNATRFMATRNNSGIFYIDAGRRRYIPSWDRFLQLGGTTGNITVVDDYTLRSFVSGENM